MLDVALNLGKAIEHIKNDGIDPSNPALTNASVREAQTEKGVARV
jgi:hypothetical protein